MVNLTNKPSFMTTRGFCCEPDPAGVYPAIWWLKLMGDPECLKGAIRKWGRNFEMCLALGGLGAGLIDNGVLLEIIRRSSVILQYTLCFISRY